MLDCVAYLGAERAACTAFLPTPSSPHAACDRVDTRQTLLYARAAFAAEICFRSLGRRATPAATTSALLAVRLYSDDDDDDDGLAACRRRLLTDAGVLRRLQSVSAADRWKCGRARRLEQVRRLRLSLNQSSSDSVLGELEQDIIATWTEERHAARWRLTLTVAALTAAVVYSLVGVACHLRRCGSVSPGDRSAVDSGSFAGDDDSNSLEGRPPLLASSLTKSTFV